MRTLLVPLDGGEPIELVKDLTLVGRKENCDLRIDHKSVSKLHCVIVKTEGMLLLRDLGSTNSSRVNGQRVRRAALLPNDRLSIAHFHFRVEFRDDDRPVSPDEYTQQLEAKEVVRLLNRSHSPLESEDDDNGDEHQPVYHNPLPDVYPEEDQRNKRRDK
ncbi:MAG: hypothetical protein KatS3mg105_3456 [Gemmatales bacterium]|nr:MAG: hypothetical protein KatS3mg105_3456 [Gemmatales bacterium]